MIKNFKRKLDPGMLSAAEERRQGKIAEIAYYLAEKRSFEPGGETEDWLRAEGMLRADEGSSDF